MTERTIASNRLAPVRRGLLWRGIAAAIAVFVSTEVQAQKPAGYKTSAASAIVMDHASGAVLFQSNADELRPPASMSKLMTLAVVFKALKEGRLRFEDDVLCSENAWRRGGAPSRTSAMFIPINTKVTVAEIIRGLIVQSGNDAAIAIAEHMAGSEAAFARLMDAEARRIGLTLSTFANASGLPQDGHLMTTRELAHLARFLMTEYPDYYPLFAEKEFKFRKHLFRNRNPALSADVRGDGLKTGFTSEAGYGVVGSVARDGRRLIVVLAGLSTSIVRNDELQRIVDWGFKGFAPYKLIEGRQIVGRARVWGGEQLYVPLTGGDDDVSVLLPRLPARQRVAAEIVYNGPLKAPIAKGQRVAVLRTRGALNNTVNEVPLYAAEDVAQGSIIRRGLDSMAMLAFRWVADQASGLIEKL
ncbi:MAG: D-alanyl-D-alanine carboxypeptidase family protein [Hyphomicrobiaceae bacterium]|nr:D-alanyl-D-alanine carboxypeptidase family protein [Hyphomicrobiaceae bacterium]